MSSKSLEAFSNRLKDVEQLLSAHSALTQFHRARKKSEKKDDDGGLNKIAEVINALIVEPGRGRPAEVEALNRAGIVLLSAHFQGYIDDLLSEAAQIILNGKVKDIDGLVKLSKPQSANPHPDIIEKMFNSIGVYEVLDEISWQKAKNDVIKKRLSDYIQLRNRIAHGKQEGVSKQKVLQFKKFVEIFTRNLDEIVSQKIQLSTGRKPW